MGWKLRRRKWTGTIERLIEDLKSAYGGKFQRMVLQLGYTGEFEPLFYNYRRRLTSLDEGLYALACVEDVRCLSTFVRSFKLIKVYIEHGVTAVDSYRRPPPQVRATIEDITDEPDSIEHRSEKMLSFPQHDSSTPCKDSVCYKRCDEAISFKETELDREAGFGNVAGSGIESSRLSRDESFRVDDLALNLNKPEPIVVEVRTREPIMEEGNGKEDESTPSDEKFFYDDERIGTSYESQYDVQYSEDASTDDDDDDLLVDEENEIVESDVDVHLFGISMDVPFDNIGVTYLVPNDVLKGEDVDVINADGFDSDLGMTMKNIKGRQSIDGLLEVSMIVSLLWIVNSERDRLIVVAVISEHDRLIVVDRDMFMMFERKAIHCGLMWIAFQDSKVYLVIEFEQRVFLFKVSTSREDRMDVKASVAVDGVGVAECFDDVIPETEVREPSVSTILMNFESKFDPYSSMSTPLYQTATFKQPSATENGPYDYTRSGNPTRDMLESLLAKLDKADRAFCFTSGMAALAAVSHLVGTGDEIVAGEDIYGGSDRLLSQVVPRTGAIVTRVDTTNLDEVAAAIGPQTKLVWLESPTNPRIQISDIRKIAKIAHANDALVLVDNSIIDVMAGVLAVKGERLAKELYFLQNAEGSGLAPFDCWICLRGIKTMALRVEKQQDSAQKIIDHLELGLGGNLSKRKFVIICHEKVVEIPLEVSRKLRVQGERTLGAAKALMNAKVDKPKLGDISVVRDFVDVFPEDFLGLPPQRQVEFRIDLVHGAMSVAMSPYRLTPLEMQELSEQLRELQDKGKEKLYAKFTKSEAVKNWEVPTTPSEI
ncbi:cystathionine beta-lyase, chloroplastic [Tanacetum coccineum]